MSKVHASKIEFTNKIVTFIKNNYENKINKVVVFGESIDETIENPECLDIAVGFTDISYATDYNMLGDIISYMGEIVTKGNCTLAPIDPNQITTSCMTLIEKGVVVYGKT